MTDEPTTPEAIVDHARLTAQAGGKPQLIEMIELLDGMLAQRCSSARVHATAYEDGAWDWEDWGRKTYVWEMILALLERIDSDPEARQYLVKRFRHEVIRGGGVEGRDGPQAS